MLLAHSRVSTNVTFQESSCLGLWRKDLLHALAEFPDIRKSLESHAKIEYIELLHERDAVVNKDHSRMMRFSTGRMSGTMGNLSDSATFQGSTTSGAKGRSSIRHLSTRGITFATVGKTSTPLCESGILQPLLGFACFTLQKEGGKRENLFIPKIMGEGVEAWNDRPYQYRGVPMELACATFFAGPHYFKTCSLKATCKERCRVYIWGELKVDSKIDDNTSVQHWRSERKHREPRTGGLEGLGWALLETDDFRWVGPLESYGRLQIWYHSLDENSTLEIPINSKWTGGVAMKTERKRNATKQALRESIVRSRHRELSSDFSEVVEEAPVATDMVHVEVVPNLSRMDQLERKCSHVQDMCETLQRQQESLDATASNLVDLVRRMDLRMQSIHMT